MQLFNIRFFSLLYTFLDILINLVNEVILSFDSLNYPIIHLINQSLEIASFLKHSLIYFIQNILLLSFYVVYRKTHKLWEKFLNSRYFIYLHFFVFFYVNETVYVRSRLVEIQDIY